jgi:eukaryotic-like serine/threonine-protein kinase
VTDLRTQLLALGTDATEIFDSEAVHQTLSPHLETIERAPHQTIRPDASGTIAPDLLAKLADQDTPLIFEGELGRGGMGVVRLALQARVGRRVAVKVLRPERETDDAVVGLLREAWLTGAIEHPNIVPVYDVDLDERGQPRVLLKRIEGTDWGALMDDPAEVRARFGVEDTLEWHLRTLMQVCAGVHAAHKRGILHRDLKPENVMVGADGEVYVVDWGIAVALRDDGDGRLPLASAARGLAGTPAYMAPEMFTGEGTRLGPRTDVYLLGGLLYRLLTDGPPHGGGNALAAMIQALHGGPAEWGDAPPELEEIGRRALSADPAARFPSADALRVAIQGFLGHRHSERVATGAAQRLHALLSDGSADPEARTRLFAECRFGFRQALEAWPTNPRARAGLRRAATFMVEAELAAGHPEAAARLIAEVERADPDLHARVEAARAAADAESHTLAALQADLDASVGARMRIVLALVVAVLWAGRPLARALFEMPRVSYLKVARGPVVAMALAGLAVWWWRKTLLTTAYNRRLLGLLFLALGCQCVLATGSHLAGVPLTVGPIYEQFLGLVLAGAATVSVERRLWPATLAYGAGFLTAAAEPARVDYVMAITNIVLVTNAWIIWRGRLPEDAR